MASKTRSLRWNRRSLRARSFLLIAVIGIVFGSVAGCAPDPESGEIATPLEAPFPNIVVILADGRDHEVTYDQPGRFSDRQ